MNNPTTSPMNMNMSKHTKTARGIIRRALAPAFAAALALLVAPGNAGAQGITFKVTPENGSIPADPSGIQHVEITPSFDYRSDYPGEVTTLMLLPRTPVVQVRAGSITSVLAAVAAGAGDRATAVAAAKTAVTDAETALAAADQAVADATKALELLESRGNTLYSLRLSELRTARIDQLQKQHDLAEANRMLAAAYEGNISELLQAKRKEIFNWSGTVSGDSRFPDGFSFSNSGNSATFGSDYYLSSGRFVLHPDGRIVPPSIRVLRLPKDSSARKEAIIAIYASTGDKKYNRPTGGKNVAEITVYFEPTSTTERRIELHLVAATASGQPEGVGDAPPLNNIRTHDSILAAFEARIVNVGTGDPDTHRDAIRLRLPKLQDHLAGPLADQVTTYFFNQGLPAAEGDADANTPPIAYQPAASHLSIPGNQSAARSGAFVLTPLLPANYPVAAPVVVDANNVAVENSLLAAIGSQVNVKQADLQLKTHTLSFSGVVRSLSSESLRAGATGSANTAVVGGVEIIVNLDAAGGCYTKNSGSALDCRPVGRVTLSDVADSANDYISATVEDFLMRQPDGSFAAADGKLQDGGFSHTYLVSVDPGTSMEYTVPVYFHRDALVEGEERAQFRFELLGADATAQSLTTTLVIPQNGTITFQAEASPAADGGNSTIEGTLVLSEGDTGIEVGAGGVVTYVSKDGIVELHFRDADGDGVLRGGELRASAVLQLVGSGNRDLGKFGILNPPGSLQGNQFNFFPLTVPTDKLATIGFADLTLSVPESDYGSVAITVSVSPALADDEFYAVHTAAENASAFVLDTSGGSATRGGAFPDLRDFSAADLQRVAVPVGHDAVAFSMTQVQDDQVVEPDETFTLALQALGGEPLEIDASKSKLTVRLTDDDIATFTVEPVAPGLARYGQPYQLIGRLSTAVQVVGSATLSVGNSDNSILFRFPDANNDGYLSEDELRSAPVSITPSAADGATRHVFDNLTATEGLSAANFHFPKSTDGGREKLWNADFLLVPEGIAPRFDNHYTITRPTKQGGVACGIPATADNPNPCTGIRGNITLQESALRLMNSDDADIKNAAIAGLSAEVNVRLSHDPNADATAVVTASYGSGASARSVSKTVTFAASADATDVMKVAFTAADFVTLGVADDDILNQPKVVTTTVTLDAATKALRDEGELLFSAASARGPHILFDDDESGLAIMRVFLADADGRPLSRVAVDQRTDAFVRVVISGSTFDRGNMLPPDPVFGADRDDIGPERIAYNASLLAAGERAITVEETLLVEVALGASGLSLTDLGNPSIPPYITIPAGASSGMSERALRITPVKGGSFGFAVGGVTPNAFGAFSAASHDPVAHSAVNGVAPQKWLVVVLVGDVTTVEGAQTPLTMDIIDAATGKSAAIMRNGASEAVTLHYTLASVESAPGAADGASAADLDGTDPFKNYTLEIVADALSAGIVPPTITADSVVEGDEYFMMTLTALVDANGLPLVEDGRVIADIAFADSTVLVKIPGSGAPTGDELIVSELVVLKEDPGRFESDTVRTGGIVITRPADYAGRIRGRISGTGVLTGTVAEVGQLSDTSTDGDGEFRFEKHEFEIPANENSTEVFVTAFADNLTEQHETFRVKITVTEPESGVLPPHREDETEVVILDGDRPLTLQLREQTLSGAEGDVVEVEVELTAANGDAPPRANPVFFTLTPSFGSASGDAAAADFMVTLQESGAQVTRAAATAAELTANGVLNPDETTASVSFLINADDAAEVEETLDFTLSLTDFAADADDARNTHDGAISLGDALTASMTIAASVAGPSQNVLVITPTTITRVYGEAAPSEFDHTVAPQDGSAFATGDTASMTFFDTNPLSLVSPGEDPDGNDLGTNAAGRYAFQFSGGDAGANYAAGIDDKYNFVLAGDVFYDITPKEITFTGTAGAGANKIYDGTVFAPQTGTFPGAFAAGDVETGDEVYATGGVYAGKDAGAGQAITGFGLAGADAGNYTPASASAALGDITARAITNLRVFIEPQAPSTSLTTITPTVDTARILADGVLPADMAGFRDGLRLRAVYDPQPTAGSTYQPVSVRVAGSGSSMAESCVVNAVAVACGPQDSGDFKAANYTLGTVETVSTRGLVGALPGVPTGLANGPAPDDSGARIAVSWSAPDAAGVPGGLLNYYVRWRTTAPAGAWQAASGASDLGQSIGAATSHTIAGLTPGTGYDVQVRAENEFGADGRGDFTASLAVTPTGKPLPPVFEELRSVSATELGAHFSAPAHTGGADATHYLARWRPASSPQNGPWTPSVDGLAVVVGDAGASDVADASLAIGETPNALSEGVKYEAQLALRTAYGDSDWSKSLSAVPVALLPAAAAPGAMSYVAMKSAGGNNLFVSWIPPVENQAKITGFEVQWALESAAFGATSARTVAAGGSNSTVLSSLSSAQNYKVQVRAVNSEGDGPWARAMHGDSDTARVTRYTGSVEFLTMWVRSVTPGDGSLVVEYSAPRFNTGDVNQHGATYANVNPYIRWRRVDDTGYLNTGKASGFALGRLNSATAVREYTISNLENGVPYFVEVWVPVTGGGTPVSASALVTKLRAHLTTLDLYTKLEAQTLVWKSGRTSADLCAALGMFFVTPDGPITHLNKCIAVYDFDAEGRPVFVDVDGNDVARNPDGSLPATAVHPKLPTAQMPIGDLTIPAVDLAATRDLQLRVGTIATPNLQPLGAVSISSLEEGASFLTLNVAWNSVSAATGYEVQWRPVSTEVVNPLNWQSAKLLAGATNYDITGYAYPGVADTGLHEIAYEVRVRARNDQGDGAWSDSRSRTPRDPRLTGMVVTAAGDDTPLVSTPPFSFGRKTAYSVSLPNAATAAHLQLTGIRGDLNVFATLPDGTWFTVQLGVRSQAIPLGAPGSSTRVTVESQTTHGGAGISANYVYTLNRAADPAGQPRNIATTFDDREISLTWEAPSDNGGSPISEYRVRWRVAGVADQKTADGEFVQGDQQRGEWLSGADGNSVGLARSSTVTGLSDGTVYELQVSAVNSSGIGRWSPDGTVVTPGVFESYDVDGSGGDADTNDAYFIARYLIGVRGDAVVANIDDTLLGAKAEQIGLDLSTGVGLDKFDVDGDGRTTASDGIMILRYFLGVTSGPGLTDGQTFATPEAVIKNMQDLGLIPQ